VALLGAHPILHVSRVTVKRLTLCNKRTIHNHKVRPCLRHGINSQTKSPKERLWTEKAHKQMFQKFQHSSFPYCGTNWGKAAPTHAMKVYRVSRGIAPLIHKFNTKLGWVVRLTPWLLYPLDRVPPGTHWIRGCTCLRAGLCIFIKRDKSPATAGIQNPDCPACSLVTIMTELSHLISTMATLASGINRQKSDCNIQPH
jgi:hypothetical protein